MPSPEPLQPEQYHHIYNRGNSGEPLFREERNHPQKHGFVDDFRDWAYSSYHTILSTQATRIQRAAVLGWFHGPAGFKEVHASPVNEGTVELLIADDWM